MTLVFSPAQIGSVRLQNRLALLPITTGLDENDEITDRYVRFYEERARGGVGLVFTGLMSTVSTRDAPTHWPGIFDRKSVPGMRKLTDAVHRHNVPIVGQVGLIYQWRTSNQSPLEAFSPSPTPVYRKIPRELTAAEIKTIIGQFVEAVGLARDGGFYGVEILACQGALLNRFLSTLTNKRTDEYGGAVENRVRPMVAIIEGARKIVGRGFAITCRLSVDELMDGGMKVPDYLPICKRLEEAGYDALSVGVGWHESTVGYLQSHVTPGSWAPVSKAIKQAVKIPVIAAQRINSVQLAEQMLSRGDADVIGMARALIADPELPAKASTGKIDRIRPCICCMRCLEAVEAPGGTVCCSVNPQAGYEGQDEIRPAASRRKVVVVGAGPAGIEAALAASARGHNVQILEQRNELGGALIEAALPPYKSEINDFVAYLRRQVAEKGVAVTAGRKADVAAIKDLKPDVVIAATGSRPIVPAIPGIAGANVLPAVDALRHPERCGQKVVVIGGGLIGCETAELLVKRGKTVKIVEMLKKAGADMGPETRWVILKRLTEAGVTIETECKATEIGADGVVAEKSGQKLALPADTVVIAVGLQPNQELDDKVKEAFPEYHFIGDCATTRKILEAVRQGFLTGLKV